MRSILVGCFTACLGLAAGSASAAPMGKDAFVASVRLNATFLARSSQLASDHSGNETLRAFAKAEIAPAEVVVKAIDTRSAPIAMRTEPATAATEDVVTGRSVAITSPAGDLSPAEEGMPMPATMVTLNHLAASRGAAFDSLYKATQTNVLRQLAALYKAYSLTGDDFVLRRMAGEELLATNTRLAAIDRL